MCFDHVGKGAMFSEAKHSEGVFELGEGMVRRQWRCFRYSLARFSDGMDLLRGNKRGRVEQDGVLKITGKSFSHVSIAVNMLLEKGQKQGVQNLDSHHLLYWISRQIG